MPMRALNLEQFCQARFSSAPRAPRERFFGFFFFWTKLLKCPDSDGLSHKPVEAPHTRSCWCRSLFGKQCYLFSVFGVKNILIRVATCVKEGRPGMAGSGSGWLSWGWRPLGRGTGGQGPFTGTFQQCSARPKKCVASVTEWWTATRKCHGADSPTQRALCEGSLSVSLQRVSHTAQRGEHNPSHKCPCVQVCTRVSVHMFACANMCVCQAQSAHMCAELGEVAERGAGGMSSGTEGGEWGEAWGALTLPLSLSKFTSVSPTRDCPARL